MKNTYRVREVEESEDGERHERVEVVRQPDIEHQEHVVEHTGVEQRREVAKVAQFIWLLAGILEGLIGLRIILKLIAANPANPFANFIYQITDLFLWPFAGLTATPAANGVVLEIHSIIAMIVYALLAWVVVKLITLLLTPSSARSVSVYRRERR